MDTLKHLAGCVDDNKNERTAYPWWMIIDPKRVRMMGEPYESRVYGIAGAITGPFFSRKSAQDFLSMTRYNFSKHAVVFCASGHNSRDWVGLIKDVRGEISEHAKVEA